MTPGEARRWVERHFGNMRRFEESSRSLIAEAEFPAVVEHLPYLTEQFSKNPTAIELFLWAGCRKFSRWAIPTPPSVPATYRTCFRSFTDALAAFETTPTNAPIFQIHALRDDVYAAFAGTPRETAAARAADLDAYASALQAIATPQHPEKRPEVDEARHRLERLLAGLKVGGVRTRLKATLPYPLTRRPLVFTMAFEGLQVRGELHSTYAIPNGLLTQTIPPNAIRPVSSTRWQYGGTTATLELDGLVDPSLQTPSLQIPGIDVPVEAWPNGFRVAFEVIYLACWALREHPDYIGIWTPAPGDIGEIESTMDLPGLAGDAMIRRGHPSVVHEVFTPSLDAVDVDLGTAALMEWHRRCRAQAEQYAALGEAREAIFWLNVGIESLLRTRMESKLREAGVDLDLDILDGGKTYWDEARELVAAQFPDLADEIEWPASGKKPSLFQQLKYFCANVAETPSFNDVRIHYSKVSRHRNALFHGVAEAPIAMAEVKRALSSFAWLAENFCPPEMTADLSKPR